MQTTFLARGGSSNEGHQTTLNTSNNGAGQGLQGNAPIQSVEFPDEPMTSPPPAPPSPLRNSMEVEFEKSVHFRVSTEQQTMSMA